MSLCPVDVSMYSLPRKSAVSTMWVEENRAGMWEAEREKTTTKEA